MPHHTDFYPMPMFPTLSVRNIDLSTSWYTDKAGFSLVFSMPGPGDTASLAHLRWRKYADLLLVPGTNSAYATHAKGAGVTLCFLVETETVDDMVARLAESGVELEEGPVERPWNTREIVVLDPDGYRLIFFEPIDVSRTFEDVIESASGRR
ncbi:MAG: VOC family protein [Dehalococcoidia bacterium]|nr:VOC family protein [Dehalococcoidia bacterium]